jgi:hypothetical protein
MKHRDFVRMIQRKVVVSAIPASALRGQGASGVVATARDFFASVSLAPFATSSPKSFARHLDDTTGKLCRQWPRAACAWGAGRKAANLFLRDALYNSYLRQEYSLQGSEAFLEVPLDFVVATALRELDGGEELSRWRGVKSLQRSQSEEYQTFARRHAQTLGVLPVHLDAYFWARKRS